MAKLCPKFKETIETVGTQKIEILTFPLGFAIKCEVQSRVWNLGFPRNPISCYLHPIVEPYDAHMFKNLDSKTIAFAMVFDGFIFMEWILVIRWRPFLLFPFNRASKNQKFLNSKTKAFSWSFLWCVVSDQGCLCFSFLSRGWGWGGYRSPLMHTCSKFWIAKQWHCNGFEGFRFLWNEFWSSDGGDEK